MFHTQVSRRKAILRGGSVATVICHWDHGEVLAGCGGCGCGAGRAMVCEASTPWLFIELATGEDVGCQIYPMFFLLNGSTSKQRVHRSSCLTSSMAADGDRPVSGQMREPPTSLHSTRTARIRIRRIGASTAAAGVRSAKRGFLMGANGGGNPKREVTPSFAAQRHPDFPISRHLQWNERAHAIVDFLRPQACP
jgi:hypothetical protein